MAGWGATEPQRARRGWGWAGGGPNCLTHPLRPARVPVKRAPPRAPPLPHARLEVPSARDLLVHDPTGPGAYLREHRESIETALALTDRSCVLHHGDARAMAAVEDASVHLVCTSPPYPLVEMWDDLFREESDLEPADPGFFDASHEVLNTVWKECHRVLAPGGILAVVIGDATRTVGGAFRCYPNHAATLSACTAMGFDALVPVLWKKPTNKPNAFLGSGFLPPNAYVTLDCEYVLIFRKPPSRTYRPKDPLRYASAFSKAERDSWFSQVWDFKGVRQATGGLARRTAAFPDEVPHRLVRMFSGLGDVVLDPFAGTGATLRVAHEWGRRAIGYEIDEEVCSYARKGLPSEARPAGEVLDALAARYGG